VSHGRTECACGNVVASCRCIDCGDKVIRVSGCSACRPRATPPDAVAPGVPVGGPASVVQEQVSRLAARLSKLERRCDALEGRKPDAHQLLHEHVSECPKLRAELEAAHAKNAEAYRDYRLMLDRAVASDAEAGKCRLLLAKCRDLLPRLIAAAQTGARASTDPLIVEALALMKEFGNG
jgi:hypothetical protein